MGPCALVRTSNSVTLCPEWPHRNVQLITRLQEAVDEILAFADLDCTSLCYDGRTLWAAERTFRAFEIGHNLVPAKMLFNRADTPERIGKYARRGFGSLIGDWHAYRLSVVSLLSEQAKTKLDKARSFSSQQPPNFVNAPDILDRIHNVQNDGECDSGDKAGMRWSADKVGEFLAKDTGYDEFHLPRGPAIGLGVIKAFLQTLQERASVPLRVSCLTDPHQVKNWADKVEWRRERQAEEWVRWGLAE